MYVSNTINPCDHLHENMRGVRGGVPQLLLLWSTWGGFYDEPLKRPVSECPVGELALIYEPPSLLVITWHCLTKERRERGGKERYRFCCH